MIYLDERMLGEGLIGPSVDQPMITDTALREQVSRLDQDLTSDDALPAQPPGRLATRGSVRRTQLDLAAARRVAADRGRSS